MVLSNKVLLGEENMIPQGALAGIKVLDLSRMLPGPYCSMILADHGAEVIAIEDKKFQHDGLFFNDLNRNKSHITLNLKTTEGLEIFFKLAEKADVIMEGFRPGVVARLGVDYQAVRRINERIIYCSISGYGQTGPLSNKVAHDVNYIADAGVLSLVGESGGKPVIPGLQLADIAGGSMNAAVGILMALFAREKTGRGQYIDISLTDGVLGLLSLPYYFSRVEGKKQQVGEMLLSHRYACYNTYKTADGRYLAIGALEKRFWTRLCEHLGLPKYIPLQYDEERRKEVIQVFQKLFATKSLEEWNSQLADLEVCFAKVKNLDEVLQDPHFSERDMVHSYNMASGEKRHGFGIPVKLSDMPGSIRTVPENFGEGTRKVLAQLGYSDEQIDNFYTRGVV